MIFARRVMAVLLGGLFLVSLLGALLVLRTSETFLRPEFYSEQFEEPGVYRFVMGDVLTSVLDDVGAMEAVDSGAGMSGNLLDAAGLTTGEVTEAVNLAISPRDLQEMAAPAIYRIGQYVTAERDAVTIRIEAGEHIRDAAYEVHQLMREAGSYDRILGREVEPGIRQVTGEVFDRNGQVSGWADYLFGNDIAAREKFVGAAMNAITPDWVAGQVEAALDPATSYLVGESASFEITVRLTDQQVAAAADEIEAILRGVDAHDLVYTGVVEPVVRDALGTEINLPYGVVVTDDEVVDALRRSAQPALVQRQAGSLAGEVSSYVVGRSDEFSIDISLARNKQEALATLSQLVETKAVEALSDMPGCATESQARDAVDRMRRQMEPSCVPPGVAVSNVLARNRSAVGRSVQAMILNPVPDVIAFSETDLRAVLREAHGAEALADLDQLRRLPGRSWSYNQDDLRSYLEGRGNALALLDGTRAFLSDGYVLSDRVRPRGRLGRRIDTALDTVRDFFSIVRSYQWAAYASAPALLVAVGFLGGTTWQGRLMWASATLLVSSIVALILSWPVYQVVAGEAFSYWRGEVAGPFEGPFAGTFLLIANRSADMIEAVAHGFMSGIRTYSLVLAALSLAVLLPAIFWERIVPMVRRPPLEYG